MWREWMDFFRFFFFLLSLHWQKCNVANHRTIWQPVKKKEQNTATQLTNHLSYCCTSIWLSFIRCQTFSTAGLRTRHHLTGPTIFAVTACFRLSRATCASQLMFIDALCQAVRPRPPTFCYPPPPTPKQHVSRFIFTPNPVHKSRWIWTDHSDRWPGTDCWHVSAKEEEEEV